MCLRFGKREQQKASKIHKLDIFESYLQKVIKKCNKNKTKYDSLIHYYDELNLLLRY